MPNEILDDDNEEALDVEDLDIDLQQNLVVQTFMYLYPIYSQIMQMEISIRTTINVL